MEIYKPAGGMAESVQIADDGESVTFNVAIPLRSLTTHITLELEYVQNLVKWMKQAKLDALIKGETNND